MFLFICTKRLEPNKVFLLFLFTIIVSFFSILLEVNLLSILLEVYLLSKLFEEFD